MAIPNRLLNPAAWATAILDFWTERRTRRLRAGATAYANNRHFAALVQSFDDLWVSLEILLTVKKDVPDLFLETRPPYMSREGPQWEPSREGYLALLEEVLENNPGVTMVGDETLERLRVQFVAPGGLPNLENTWTSLTNRWAYERDRLHRQARRRFCNETEEDLIAKALHPTRIGRLLNTYGWAALEELF